MYKSYPYSLSLFIAVLSLFLFSCSDDGSDSSPTGNNTQLYDVTVTISPSEGGTISPSSDSSYEEGSQVSLQASPTDAYTFSGWTGTIDTTANPVTITVDKDYNLTANFQIKSYELSLTTNGEGTVTEQVVQQKTDYEHGTIVELTANPAEGWKFVEWQGDVTGAENPAQITVDNPKSVTAVFEKKFYSLTINTEGEGAVTKEVIQAKVTDYEFGTTVELTANPATGWQFVEWQGDLTGTQNPEQITVDTAKTLTALFEKKTYAVNVSTSGEGSVSKSPDQTEYEFGSLVDITANPDTGWEFKSWDGDTTSTDNPLTISIDSAITITAVFINPTFAGGNGTIEYPYQVSTVDQLQAINNYTDSYFIQINDIDASITSTWNGGAGFVPIGDDIVKFTGHYNGNSYKISYLKIDRAEDWYLGLFGYVENGMIKNVTLESVNIIGNERIGGIVGRNNGLVQNSSSKGQVNGRNHVGGLVGLNSGKIQSTYSSVEVSTANNAGGLVGSNSGKVNDSYSTSKVSGSFRVGGLVGENSGKIIESYSSGRVSAQTSVGGLVGWNRLSGEINKSYSLSTTSGEERVGGLVGENNNGHSKISNSYAQGDVEGDNSVGGLAGVNSDNGNIKNAYASGNVTATTDVGGLVGSNGATIEGSYWDIESTNQTTAVGRGSSDGTIGLTTSEMTGSSAETNMSAFDFVNIWVTTSSYPTLF